MPLPTFYATGTASVANGATTITFAGALLGTADLPTFRPGDEFFDPAQPGIPGQRLASVDYIAGTAQLWAGWPGTSMTTDPYEVRFVDDGTRSTAQTRRYLEMLGQLSALGIQPNAFGEFADRGAYDDEAAGYIFLSLDGDGSTGIWTLYIKESAAAGDWDAGQPIEGPEGLQGDPGLIGDWIGPWVAGTYPALKGVAHNGTSYISKVETAQEPPHGDWDVVAAKGDTGIGNDGRFSGTEVIKTGAYTALAADVGKTFILNKATADTLAFDPAATLGSTWMVMIKNVGAGTWTLDPDGAETIDGVASNSLASGQSCVVASNGAAIRTLFKGSTTAADVSFSPTGNIAATSVQAAIAEVDNEKAGLAASNTFSASQTISLSGAFAIPMSFVSTNPDATAGPYLYLLRDSPSPAVGDFLATVSMRGRDSAGNSATYGEFYTTIVSPTDGAESGDIRFVTVQSGAGGERLRIGGGLYHPSATGGDKGSNTINFGAVYDDNTLLTCMALQSEYLERGEIDLEKWDALVPDQVVPERREQFPVTYTVTEVKDAAVVEPDTEGRLVRRIVRQEAERELQMVWADPVYDEQGTIVDAIETPLFDEVVIPEQVLPRQHGTARLFADMLADGFDPRDPAKYVAKLKADQALPGMPTQADWQHNGLSSGEMLGRLWLATEMLAIVVMNLHERVSELEVTASAG